MREKSSHVNVGFQQNTKTHVLPIAVSTHGPLHSKLRLAKVIAWWTKAHLSKLMLEHFQEWVKLEACAYLSLDQSGVVL